MSKSDKDNNKDKEIQEVFNELKEKLVDKNNNQFLGKDNKVISQNQKNEKSGGIAI